MSTDTALGWLTVTSGWGTKNTWY